MDKRRESIPLSPLQWELAIMALTLLLGLLLLLPAHLRIREREAAAAEQRALTLALTSAAEELKADPVGDGAFENGERIQRMERGQAAITARIRQERRPAGTYYAIDLWARGPLGTELALGTGIYRPGEVGE